MRFVAFEAPVDADERWLNGCLQLFVVWPQHSNNRLCYSCRDWTEFFCVDADLGQLKMTGSGFDMVNKIVHPLCAHQYEICAVWAICLVAAIYQRSRVHY